MKKNAMIGARPGKRAALAGLAAVLLLAPGVRPAGAVGAGPAECVLAHLSKFDLGPTPADVASCGGDVAGELLRHALGEAPNGLVRGRAIGMLPIFAPDEAAIVLADILADGAEHAYFRAKAIGAAAQLAATHPAEVLGMVEVALAAAADPYVRERAMDTSLRLPGKMALEALKAHRLRERARWLMPILKRTVETLEAR